MGMGRAGDEEKRGWFLFQAGPVFFVRLPVWSLELSSRQSRLERLQETCRPVAWLKAMLFLRSQVVERGLKVHHHQADSGKLEKEEGLPCDELSRTEL